MQNFFPPTLQHCYHRLSLLFMNKLTGIGKAMHKQGWRARTTKHAGMTRSETKWTISLYLSKIVSKMENRKCVCSEPSNKMLN